MTRTKTTTWPGAQDARNSQPEAPGPKFLTPQEAGGLLRISTRTLANWRSQGSGPCYRKLGGRVVYPLRGVMDFGAEIKGFGKTGKPHVKVTARTLSNGKIQIDMLFPEPMKRQRPFAPPGMDLAQAQAWGEREADRRMREHLKLPAAEINEEKSTTIKQESKPSETKPRTLGELWVIYEAQLTQGNDGTRIAYQKRWRKIQAKVKDIPADCWTKDDSTKLATFMEKHGARYANQCMTLVRNILRIDIAAEDLPNMPRRKPKKKKMEAAHADDDLEALILAAKVMSRNYNEPFEAMLLLGIDGGLRPGEVAGLRWTDIDWKANQLMVQNQRPTSGMPEDEDLEVKWGEAGRVTMTQRLRIALESLRMSGKRSRYVITNSEGEALYTTLISDRILRIHEASGLPVKKRAHFMRHCSASRIIHHPQAGVIDVRDHLRHKRVITTEQYLHDLRGSEPSRRAAAFLDQLNDGDGNELAVNGTPLQSERLRLN